MARAHLLRIEFLWICFSSGVVFVSLWGMNQRSEISSSLLALIRHLGEHGYNGVLFQLEFLQYSFSGYHPSW